MKGIIEFLHLTQTFQEIDEELKELNSFIKNFVKPKKKIVIPKVIPFLNEDTVDEWLKDLSLKEDTVQKEYCYEDDNFTYTNDP
tara:strand:- start:1313 stop:1564 length:252 start_codon:yes stop_codon:yes gene_type:complete